MHHRFQKKLCDEAEQDTKREHHVDNIADTGFGSLFLACTHSQIKISSTADSAQKGDGSTDDREGKSHVGCGISKHTDTSADEKLIDDIVKCTDQHGNDAGNCEFCQ